MLMLGMKVRVYDGEFIGWTTGMLVKHINEDRWTIFTKEEYMLDRHIKEEYKEFKTDGCGYVIPSSSCPECGSYEVDDEDRKNMSCYVCDAKWSV